ncbi:MAG: HIT family protein [Methanobacteriaceae archaeon]|nr:HIT family protein [Methanobacteriaceae archaeon]
MEYKLLKRLMHGPIDFIADTEHWIIFLDRDQKNLGTCVVALKREAKLLSELTLNEWDDFKDIVRALESALKKAFDVTMFNWGCLLNTAYIKIPANPQVHWHLIPRYREPVKFKEIIFIDPCFGKSTLSVAGKKLDLNPEIREEIIKKIRDNLTLS